MRQYIAYIEKNFVAMCHGIKCLYNKKYKQRRFVKEWNTAVKDKRGKLNIEIKEFEKQLVLTVRLSSMLDYDPYYFKRNSNRI